MASVTRQRLKKKLKKGKRVFSKSKLKDFHLSYRRKISEKGNMTLASAASNLVDSLEKKNLYSTSD